MKEAQIPIQQNNSDYIPLMIDQIKDFSKSKRKWLKAFEVLSDIVRSTVEIFDKKERTIFNYQFLLNFLSKGSLEE